MERLTITQRFDRWLDHRPIRRIWLVIALATVAVVLFATDWTTSPTDHRPPTMVATKAPRFTPDGYMGPATGWALQNWRPAAWTFGKPYTATVTDPATGQTFPLSVPSHTWLSNHSLAFNFGAWEGYTTTSYPTREACEAERGTHTQLVAYQMGWMRCRNLSGSRASRVGQ